MKKFERFVVDGAFIERFNGNTPYAEIIYRLHYLENIMEKYKCFTPQELDQRIAELEEENNELKESNRIKTYYVSECNQLYDEQQKELAKLKEQLQRNLKHNWPKSEDFSELKHPLQVYVISNGEVIKGKVFISCRDLLLVSPDGEEPTWFCQDSFFFTEAEAQKHLEERK